LLWRALTSQKVGIRACKVILEFVRRRSLAKLKQLLLIQWIGKDGVMQSAYQLSRYTIYKSIIDEYELIAGIMRPLPAMPLSTGSGTLGVSNFFFSSL